MFLDDKLYEWVKLKEINNSSDFKEMINELYRICEDHYKPQLPKPGTPEGTFKNVRIIMNRTFISWDLFIKKLEKESYTFITILKKKEVSYKEAYLNNPQLKEIYDKGK